MEPLVSVVIPIYNVENFLKDTLESVCNQTYKNLEIICVDDGSTDNSLSVANFYSAKDKRIKVISQENAGVSAARNHGIKEAKGEYICFLDSDDFMHPQNVELQVRAMEQSGADLVFCYFKNVAKTAELGDFNTLKPQQAKVSNTPLGDFIFKRSKIDSSSCNKLYKCKLVKENPFKLGISRGEDEIFVLNLLTKIKKIAANPEVLVFFRNRGGSLTKQSISETYLFDHYLSFVSMSEILLRPEILLQAKLNLGQIKTYMAKKIYKRFVVHVLRKNKKLAASQHLVDIAIDYLKKLMAAQVFETKYLPWSRQVMLKLFMQKKALSLISKICKW